MNDSLSLWNDCSFIRQLKRNLLMWDAPNSPHSIVNQNRMAVFDLDGTLWCETPGLVEMRFWRDELEACLALDEYKQHHLTVLSLLKTVEDESLTIMMNLYRLYHTVFANEDHKVYQKKAKRWVCSARHPRFQVPYAQLVYQPMLQLIRLLQHHGFRCVINSGSTKQFVQAWSEEVLGIPMEDVLGSSFDVSSPSCSIALNLGQEKVEHFKEHFKGVPVIAIGNTFNDLSMLKWVHQSHKNSVCALVNHDDASREYLYPFNPLVNIEMSTQFTSIHSISMKQDWREVFDI
ncbi:HAD family hydrolase [Vibrio sp. 10N.261.46.E11]|uniref:HAD family hydrolase n=1 Tax=Vibrio sp. 10N.261.46.E11 TaxID=3229662 RepID=UPI00354CB602